MGRPGRRIVRKLLPGLRITHDIDLVIAQAENVSHGKGMSLRHYNELEEYGVDAFSGGNHTFERHETMALVDSLGAPVTAPANYEVGNHPAFKLISVKNKKVAIISLLGYTIPHGYSDATQNPLITADSILQELTLSNPDAIIVNIHSDVSSEKVMMGHYLDGKVTAVLGDHWHIPTADARLLPQQTAHVTDVGMCGVLNSSLGVEADTAIRRWKGEKVKHHMADMGTLQFNAVLVKVKSDSLLASSIERIQLYTD